MTTLATALALAAVAALVIALRVSHALRRTRPVEHTDAGGHVEVKP